MRAPDHRMIMVADGSGEEDLEVHTEDSSCPPRRLGIDPLVLGRPKELAVSPTVSTHPDMGYTSDTCTGG